MEGQLVTENDRVDSEGVPAELEHPIRLERLANRHSLESSKTKDQ